jgi:UDP-N-acetyl-D-glucosamine dehydrogenase
MEIHPPWGAPGVRTIRPDGEAHRVAEHIEAGGRDRGGDAQRGRRRSSGKATMVDRSYHPVMVTRPIEANDLRSRIADRTAVIGVVGLGYVGLPLVTAFTRAGFTVIGVDLSATKIQELLGGRSYILDVPSSDVSSAVAAGRLRAVTDYLPLAEADVIFVCVPTPFDRAKAPDLSFIIAAANGIAPVLRPGQLVILESTTYPGTTDEVLVPLLERSGLRAGADFQVAFSPERIDPGNKTFRISNTPKVVGGVDAESTAIAALVLEQIVDGGKVHRVSTARAAELTKLLENTFRAVNIALVNELAILCDRMGIDVWEVIEAAKTKPYGFMPFFPGPGVGGHCIPVDPYYLAWKAREFDFSTKFIEVAAETNQSMPFFTVAKIGRTLRERGVVLSGASVLVLGAAFKKDIEDARNSSAIRVIEILLHEGARVRYHDPYVPEITVGTKLYASNGSSQRLRSVDLGDHELGSADCVAILVGHSAIDYRRVIDTARFVFDAVNATGGIPAPGQRVVRL